MLHDVKASDPSQVLVIDDDPSVCDLVGVWLRQAGLVPAVAQDAAAGLDALSTTMPQVVCLDLSLPDRHGLDVLGDLNTRSPDLPVIIMTADHHAESVVSAMRAGAYDYLTKPLDKVRLTTTVLRAIERSTMQARLQRLEREAQGRNYRGIIGRSPQMREFFAQLDQIAARDISVLVHGESGTGKELVARALHEQSPRSAGPLVTINCAAIAETLQESELFGHEKGAFTGAEQLRKGRFELAHGGTLFLDEVAELSPSLQAKLLRVLQERSFTRVGGSTLIESDFRLVAASHKRLEDEVQAQRFRSDLFYRLAVFEVEVPPLRARGDDIQLLAERFVLELAEGPMRLSPAAIQVLKDHGWPGNVRELRNAIHRAVVVARDGIIDVSDLPRGLAASATREVPARAVPIPPGTQDLLPMHEGQILTLDEIEHRSIVEAIARTNGNLSEVVRQLGIGRTTLYRKLKKYGIPR